ncbi:MAG: ABC transporter ATP-binding protein [Nitrospirae bacterium]|nr:ABC transporter ATP-binding protein [Magnetococcales bacterium]HAT51245.1 hypothetical protein [Alphaproteobacteria bacterium]
MILRRIITVVPFFFRPFLLSLLVVFFIGIIQVVFETLFLMVSYPLLTSLLNPDGGPSSGLAIGFVTDLLDKINPEHGYKIPVFFFIITIILKNLFHFLSEFRARVLGERIRAEFTQRIFAKYLLSDWEYMMAKKQGDLVHNIMQAPGRMTAIIGRIPVFVTEAIKLTAIFSLLLTIAFKAVLAGLVAAVIFGVLVSSVGKRVTYITGKHSVEASENMSVIVNESLNGFQQLRIHQAEAGWLGRFFQNNALMSSVNIRSAGFTLAINRSVEVLVFTLICTVLLIVDQEDIRTVLPTVGLFFLAIMRILPSLSAMGNDWVTAVERLPFAETLYAALHDETNKFQNGTQQIASIGSIRFDQVHYHYPNRDESVLKDVSFTIHPSKMTALVGHSGSGKSTIGSLLVGVVRPSAGRIMVEGIDMSDIDMSSWRNRIGYVSQDTFIFHNTIRENIRFGHEYTDEEVIEAANVANAHGFISELPDGYETVVGDRGLRLSGGQRQRIAIARAVIRKPELLILDEATSSLDRVSEHAVQTAIDQLSGRYTVVVIAHRLETIRKADMIVVMQNGHVVEIGLHQELIDRGGEYTNLHRKVV